MDIKPKKFLIYVGYFKENKEILIDYTITAKSKADAMNKAHSKMIAMNGIRRSIYECHEITKEFLAKEKSFTGHEGRAL